MEQHKLIFRKRVKRTESVSSFRFDPAESLHFEAGQFARLLFDANEPKNKDLNKYLSFSCKPGSGYIEFTKKLSGSNFSKSLLNLSEGDELIINGPMGKCVFDISDEKALFIAGGIGITPVMSILGDRFENNSDSRDLKLLYLNVNEDQIAFRSELEDWEKRNRNLKIIHALEEPSENITDADTGRITADMIKDAAPDYKERRIYIFGPPIMVKITNDICLSIDCSPGMMTIEKFAGY